MTKSESLITTEFLVFNGVTFLAFCNIALFFQFHEYLGTLAIDPQWFGLLIALFSLVVLVIRPIISPFLHPENSHRWIAISSCFVIAALALYGPAQTFWSMALVRMFHGVAYVVLATALLSGIVGCIPHDRSGQAFGLMAVITLLPYAVVPPLLKPLTYWFGGFNRVLVLSALMMVLVFPLLALVSRKGDGPTAAPVERINWQDFVVNLKSFRLLSLFAISLLLWTAFTAVFFFLKGYGDMLHVANPGWFFTLSTFTEIAVRVVGGASFDKLDKTKMLAASLAWLTVGYVALAHVSSEAVFYGLGLFLGIGWGIAMPVLSGLTFDVSAPKFRAMNTNMTMVMFQAGFFLGPIMGSAVLESWSYSVLYYVCAILSLVALMATPILISKTETRT